MIAQQENVKSSKTNMTNVRIYVQCPRYSRYDSPSVFTTGRGTKSCGMILANVHIALKGHPKVTIHSSFRRGAFRRLKRIEHRRKLRSPWKRLWPLGDLGGSLVRWAGRFGRCHSLYDVRGPLESERHQATSGSFGVLIAFGSPFPAKRSSVPDGMWKYVE